ncbi:hypothetical protein V1478_005662 [Vespula squamosa]|uniref:Uncharacterized protein n=1 Tax=Vespula squamosa TaxID=30214 RepID=A0ABD2BAA5_VESSQ
MGVAEGLKKLFFQKRRVYPTQDFPIILKSFKKHYLEVFDERKFSGSSTIRLELHCASSKSSAGNIINI